MVADPSDLERAAQILNDGNKVAILAGRGALQATAELELLADVLESETTDRKIDWRVGSLPSVNCDPGLIQQVFREPSVQCRQIYTPS